MSARGPSHNPEGWTVVGEEAVEYFDSRGEPIDTSPSRRPTQSLSPGEWARRNLFSTWYNSVFTVVFGGFLAYMAYRGLRFVFVTADWEIIERNLTTFLVGRYPRDETWRVWLASALLALTLGFVGGISARLADQRRVEMGDAPERIGVSGWLRRTWPVLLLGVVLVVFSSEPLQAGAYLVGAVALVVVARLGGRHAPRFLARLAWLILGVGVLVALLILGISITIPFVDVTLQVGDGVPLDLWGGLLLTLFATVFGIILAFPFGLLLALGRRSTLPAVKGISIVYIEFIRGVPLITLLLMGQFMIGFFLPPGWEPPSTVARALIAIVLFEAAYVAEVVRGGLQGIPKGQYEAAQAVGLRPWKSMRLIILPQALRSVIPAMVGQFISLFKDTSLLAILGLFEILDIAQTVTNQPDFLAQGLHSVTLAFVGFIYWVGSYTMSRESQRLERKLGVGER